LGEYEVYDELGRGGMATVFLGYEIALGRHVAIKVMAPALSLEEGMTERFQREAKIAANLSHPHIIPVYAVRETEQLSFFVMKYVDGSTLEAIITEHAPLPIELVRHLLVQVGGALDHAHSHGVVHRDVKPANILIDTDGWALVTDFGIAKMSGQAGLTATGAAVGTPYYMSPEQCSHGEVTGHADQYSFGAVAYQMLCGRVPFRGADSGEVMRAHVMDPPEALGALRPDCPASLAAAVMRMLSKKPADRWPTLGALVTHVRSESVAAQAPVLDQLKALARTGPVRPALPRPPVSPSPSSRKPLAIASARGRRIRFASALVLLLGLFGVAGVMIANRMGVGTVPAGSTPPADSGNAFASVVPPAAPTAMDSSGKSEGIESGKPSAPASAQPTKRSALPGPAIPAARGAQMRTAVPGTAAADSAARVPVARGEWAWIYLGTKHEEAVLYINGVPRLPISPSLRWWKVPQGQLTLSLKADGCTPWEETLSVAGGDSLRLGNRYPACP
jgi:serine/threonine protein kinase